MGLTIDKLKLMLFWRFWDIDCVNMHMHLMRQGHRIEISWHLALWEVLSWISNYNKQQKYDCFLWDVKKHYWSHFAPHLQCLHFINRCANASTFTIQLFITGSLLEIITIPVTACRCNNHWYIFIYKALIWLPSIFSFMLCWNQIPD